MNSFCNRLCGLFLNISKYVVIVLGGIIATILTFYSLTQTCFIETTYDEIIHYRKDSIVGNIIAIIFICVIVVVVAMLVSKIEWLTPNKLILIQCIILGAGCLYLSLNVRTNPFADQKSIYKIATFFIDNDTEEMTEYFSRFPYQMGIAFFYELFLRIVGIECGLTGLHILNSICYVMAVFFLSHITYELFENKFILVCEILLAMAFIPYMLYVTFIYGDIPCMTFMFAGFYFFIKFDKTKKGKLVIPMLIAFAIMYILKKNTLIFIIAIVIVTICKIFENKKIQWFLCVIALIIFSTSLMPIVRKVYEDRTEIEFRKGVPMNAYLVMGLNEYENPGWYSGYVLDIYDKYDGSYELMKEDASDKILSRLEYLRSNSEYAMKFFRDKTLSQWNEPTYEAFQMNNIFSEEPNEFIDSVYFGKINHYLCIWMDRYQFVIYCLFLIFIVSLVRNSINLNKYLFIIYIIGGFLFQLVWEAKGRYVYPYVVCMIPCAASSIYYLYSKICNKMKHKLEIGPKSKM